MRFKVVVESGVDLICDSTDSCRDCNAILWNYPLESQKVSGIAFDSNARFYRIALKTIEVMAVVLCVILARNERNKT